jgi:hypothetical protein
MIFKNIFAKKIGEKIGVLSQSKAKLCKNLSQHWFLRKNTNFVRRKLSKIAEN